MSKTYTIRHPPETGTTYELTRGSAGLPPHIIDIYLYLYSISGMQTQREKVIELLEKTPLILSSELTGHGIDRKTVKRMVESGELIRVSHGLYRSPDYLPDTHYSLLEAQKIVRNGVICLLSALSYYEIGTQNPSQVWVAVPRNTWQPDTSNTPIQVVTFSKKAIENGLTQVLIENTPVRIFNIPKTIADCFKFRNKIGLDVAIEALKDVLYGKKTSIDEMLHYAELCRVKAVMIPYLESLV